MRRARADLDGNRTRLDGIQKHESIFRTAGACTPVSGMHPRPLEYLKMHKEWTDAGVLRSSTGYHTSVSETHMGASSSLRAVPCPKPTGLRITYAHIVHRVRSHVPQRHCATYPLPYVENARAVRRSRPDEYICYLRTSGSLFWPLGLSR
ncbi:hypothetical protein DFP72DRAFT_886445 [Ephemerocybe angulata]|uniref:Uncharacterized protein n=1 Tax=Ephemerocybe angulata TaxID=980116 RepID=A0A8H6I6H0_9AGAR|nr:hypothetical protein DFP72DRAFT_886424 [Tulosesus angulatus]KAF6758793.1 hypothetical protein DFP72DRAFT_886445 [Tulosesus angulatus]